MLGFCRCLGTLGFGGAGRAGMLSPPDFPPAVASLPRSGEPGAGARTPAVSSPGQKGSRSCLALLPTLLGQRSAAVRSLLRGAGTAAAPTAEPSADAGCGPQQPSSAVGFQQAGHSSGLACRCAGRRPWSWQGWARLGARIPRGSCGAGEGQAGHRRRERRRELRSAARTPPAQVSPAGSQVLLAACSTRCKTIPICSRQCSLCRVINLV